MVELYLLEKKDSAMNEEAFVGVRAECKSLSFALNDAKKRVFHVKADLPNTSVKIGVSGARDELRQ